MATSTATRRRKLRDSLILQIEQMSHAHVQPRRMLSEVYTADAQAQAQTMDTMEKDVLECRKETAEYLMECLRDYVEEGCVWSAAAVGTAVSPSVTPYVDPSVAVAGAASVDKRKEAEAEAECDTGDSEETHVHSNRKTGPRMSNGSEETHVHNNRKTGPRMSNGSEETHVHSNRKAGPRMSNGSEETQVHSNRKTGPRMSNGSEERQVHSNRKTGPRMSDTKDGDTKTPPHIQHSTILQRYVNQINMEESEERRIIKSMEEDNPFDGKNLKEKEGLGKHKGWNNQENRKRMSMPPRSMCAKMIR